MHPATPMLRASRLLCSERTRGGGGDMNGGTFGRSKLVEDLRQIHAGRVLDVATGDGTFARFLVEHLGSFEEIVGVDLSAPPESPESVFARDDVSFVEMNANRLSFSDAAFDMVAISSSLHHFPAPRTVLAEMRRALAPSGWFVVRETHSDVSDGPDRTDMMLHRWGAQIDRLLGSYHAVTYTRREILELVAAIHLDSVRVYDVRHSDADPFDEGAVRSTERCIDANLREVARLPERTELKRQAEELRRWLREVGIRWEPEVIIVGRKP